MDTFSMAKRKKVGKGKKGAASPAPPLPQPQPHPKETEDREAQKEKAEAEVEVEAEEEPKNDTEVTVEKTPKKQSVPPSAEKENGVPKKKVKREEDDGTTVKDAGGATPTTDSKQALRKWGKYQASLIELMIYDMTNGWDAHQHRTKGDSHWTDLTDRLNQKLAFEEHFTKDQVYEKVKRLKAKFEREEKNPPKNRKSELKTFHELMKKLWGSKDGVKVKKEVNSGEEEEEVNSGDEAAARPVVKRLKLSGLASEVGQQQQQLQLVSDSVFGLAASLNSDMGKLVSSYSCVELPNRIKKRIVEEKLAECANLKRKLQFAAELCSYHEDMLELEKASL